MEILRWEADYEEGFCVIKDPDIKLERDLFLGISRVEDHPPDVSCKMDPEYPNDLKLADNLYGSSHRIISRIVKDFLNKELSKVRVEYLPVKIINHKGRIASEDYFILHPLEIYDCIDKEKSGVVWNKINPNKISNCKKLTINAANIPDHIKIFRPKFWGENIFIQSDLAMALIAAGFTRLDFRKAEGFNGIN